MTQGRLLSETAQKLDRARWRCTWAIADWLCHGIARGYIGGTRYDIAQDITGRSRGYLANLAWLGRAFPSSRRNEDASLSHHAAVARLPEAEGEELLAAAVCGHWSLRKLRAEVEQRQRGDAPPDDPEPTRRSHSPEPDPDPVSSVQRAVESAVRLVARATAEMESVQDALPGVEAQNDEVRMKVASLLSGVHFLAQLVTSDAEAQRRSTSAARTSKVRRSVS